MSRHVSVLKGVSYICTTCKKPIKDGQFCVVVVKEEGREFYHPVCEPQESRKNEITIR